MWLRPTLPLDSRTQTQSPEPVRSLNRLSPLPTCLLASLPLWIKDKQTAHERVCTPSERRQLPAKPSPSMASLSPSLHLPWYASSSRLIPSPHCRLQRRVFSIFFLLKCTEPLWFHPCRSRIAPVAGGVGWICCASCSGPPAFVVGCI